MFAPGIRTERVRRLYDHQQDALAWMLQRERRPRVQRSPLYVARRGVPAPGLDDACGLLV